MGPVHPAALPAGAELLQERVGVRARILVTDIRHGTRPSCRRLGDVVLELELDADLGLVVGRRQVHDVRRGHARREVPAVEVDELPVELHDGCTASVDHLGHSSYALASLRPLTAFSIHSSSPWSCGWPSPWSCGWLSPWVWSISPFGTGFTAMSTPGSLRSSGLSSQTICPPLVRSTCRSVRLASRTIPPVTPPLSSKVTALHWGGPESSGDHPWRTRSSPVGSGFFSPAARRFCTSSMPRLFGQAWKPMVG